MPTSDKTTNKAPWSTTLHLLLLLWMSLVSAFSQFSQWTRLPGALLYTCSCSCEWVQWVRLVSLVSEQGSLEHYFTPALAPAPVNELSSLHCLVSWNMRKGLFLHHHLLLLLLLLLLLATTTTSSSSSSGGRRNKRPAFFGTWLEFVEQGFVSPFLVWFVD